MQNCLLLLIFFLTFQVSTALPAESNRAVRHFAEICRYPAFWPGTFGNQGIMCAYDVLASFSEEEAASKVDLFWSEVAPKLGATWHGLGQQDELLELEAKLRDKYLQDRAEQDRINSEAIAERQRENAADALRTERSEPEEEIDKAAKKARERTAYLADHPTSEKLNSLSIRELCNLTRRTHSKDSLQELGRRNAFSQEELTLIAKDEIEIGMSEGALVCSWGEPRRKNRTVTARSESVQWIYGGTYVYTVNGIVRSWQD